MEKLIELLNKFEKEKIISEGGRVDEDDEYFGRSLEGGDIVNRSFDRDAHGFFKYQIISKDFKFIERLVKKDKVDIEKLLNIQNEYFRLQIGNDNYNSENYFVDGLLMLLAIQDYPIDFLIEILK